MRTLPKLGEELMRQLEADWKEKQPDWERKRLLVLRLIGGHEHTAEQVEKIVGVCRRRLFKWRNKAVEGGVRGLIERKERPGRPERVKGAVEEEKLEKLAGGKFRNAREAEQWVRKRTRKEMSQSGARQLMRRLGGRLKKPRKSHARKDPAKAEAFREGLPQRLEGLAGEEARKGKAARNWVLDGHRHGLLPVLVRVWGLKGRRVYAPCQTRYQWGYLHEALEVDGGHRSELLFTPTVNQDVHALFLEQIGRLEPEALHVVIADNAGYHFKEGDGRIPANVRLLPLPPYCPELNPVERFGGLVKAEVGNRLYETLERLEARIAAAALYWGSPARVSSLIHKCLSIKVNSGVTPYSILIYRRWYDRI